MIKMARHCMGPGCCTALPIIPCLYTMSSYFCASAWNVNFDNVTRELWLRAMAVEDRFVVLQCYCYDHTTSS
jgi:hypothetical protein